MVCASVVIGLHELLIELRRTLKIKSLECGANVDFCSFEEVFRRPDDLLRCVPALEG